MIGCAGGFVCTGALWLGGGAYLFLVGTEQEDEQGLRAAAEELGSLHLRGYEPSYGEEIGSLMRLFRQSQSARL